MAMVETDEPPTTKTQRQVAGPGPRKRRGSLGRPVTKDAFRRARPFAVALACLAALLAPASLAAADPPARSDVSAEPGSSLRSEGEGACAWAAPAVHPRHVALEINLLWPILPGIFEARLMIPVLRTNQRDWRGEIVTGAYADYASWVIRDSASGKVRSLMGKLGYRQFFVSGLHLEVTANMGWRHEEDRPSSGPTVYPKNIDAFQTRLWVLAGYQYELSRILYANARGGISLNVYRSDAYAYLEKQVVPGVDVNFGVRF
jgi:hypothetical protein